MSGLRLVGTVETARLLGVSRQRADQLSRTKGFPEPVARLACGRIWEAGEVESWALRTGRAEVTTGSVSEPLSEWKTATIARGVPHR